MPDPSLEIRNLLQQDRLIVLELLDSSNRLIFELETTHHWIHLTLENYKMLANIGQNLSRMLEECSGNWGEGKKIFQREPAMKLFKTALGLYRALPPINAKYAEQLSRRRRQRIMGEELVDMEGLDPVVVENDKQQAGREFARLREMFSSMEARIAEIPEGLMPVLQAPAAEPNGHHEESGIPGVQIGDKVASSQAPAQAPSETPPAEPDSTGSSPL
ncbi:hypothetical protein KDL44_07005 [bacterium]|nr:hypothetical protein [bacterium]